MTRKDAILAIVSIVVLIGIGPVILSPVRTVAGEEVARQMPDSLRDFTLENRMALCGVPDSQIVSLMWMRQKQVVTNSGALVDGRYFYVSPDRRRGWIVTLDGGCITVGEKVFDLDDRESLK